jgi:hypothetical protein
MGSIPPLCGDVKKKAEKQGLGIRGERKIGKVVFFNHTRLWVSPLGAFQVFAPGVSRVLAFPSREKVPGKFLLFPKP